MLPVTQGPPDPAAPAEGSLPEPVAALLASQGWRVAEACDVSVRPDRAWGRRTQRVVLLDGRAVKARLLRNEAAVARIARWLPLLPAPGFSPLLASRGRATVEPWIEGGPVAPGDDAVAEAAGALLGACHDAVPRRVVAAEGAEVRGAVVFALRRVDHLASVGAVEGAHALRIRRALRDASPRAATLGLAHGDYAPENLVRAASGDVVCVDNTTLRPGLLEADLGFAWNRWPLAQGGRERFLLGYRRRADPTGFLAAERFFRLAEALRSAAWRSARGAPGLALPLAEVAALVP